jgi:hypothetical protein
MVPVSSRRAEMIVEPWVRQQEVGEVFEDSAVFQRLTDDTYKLPYTGIAQSTR